MVSGYLDSVPIFLEGFFGLSPAACGSLVAVLGLSLAPCSIALGRLSSKVSDRRCIPHPRALAVWMVLDLALCVCLRNTACWCLLDDVVESCGGCFELALQPSGSVTHLDSVGSVGCAWGFANGGRAVRWAGSRWVRWRRRERAARCSLSLCGSSQSTLLPVP